MEYNNNQKLLDIQRKIDNLKSFMEDNLPERIVEDFRIPGIPGLWGGIDIPDIPSMDSIFNEIKNKIKSGLVDPVENGFKNLIRDVESGLKGSINTVKTTFEGLINDIKKGFDEAMAKVKGFFDSIVAKINSGFDVIKQTFEDLKTKIDGMINDLKKGFNDAMVQVKGFFDDLMKKITAGFAVIESFFKDFVNRMKKMGNALKDIFGGIGTEFTGLGEGLNLGFTNIGVLFKWTGEFVFSYITCGIQYIRNLHRCIFFYVLDTLGYTMYSIFIGIPLWILITFMKIDLYKNMDNLWDKIYEYDAYIYGYTGFHIAHYPKNIRNLCYNCKRMKINALKNKVSEINNDFLVKMPGLLNKGVVEMNRGGDDFLSAFK
jgi:hypothetical protein